MSEIACSQQVSRAIIRAMKNLTHLVILVVALLTSGQAQTPQNSAKFRVAKIAFEVSHGGFPMPQTDIFVRDSLNSKPKSLVSGMMPVWSPDGQRLVFCTRQGPNSFGQAEIINIDGSGRSQLTHLRGGACPTDWSPDGEKLALMAYGTKPPMTLVIGKNGGDVLQITAGYGAHWSPDGKQLVLCRSPQGHVASGSIWIASADGTGVVRKVIEDNSNVLEAAWFSDGKSIVFSSEREDKHKSKIFRVNLDGSGLELLQQDKHLALYFPVLSPDGQQLVVDGIDSAQNGKVLMLDLASHSASVLAHGLHASVLWETR